jgi:glycerophosphoryl diester phosphodiesterase
MSSLYPKLALALVLTALAACGDNETTVTPDATANVPTPDANKPDVAPVEQTVHLGPRPFYLVNDMEPSELKTALLECQNGPFEKTNFSIGHRGAAMQFPEHTKESYMAAAQMGAGIVECDVTFTKDRQLVCRHSQCDLHTTTNILAVPELAAKCTQPFTPADLTADPFIPASANCCTSDITLEEFKSLCGKMDAFDPRATTVEQYMRGTADWRTDLYATCGTLLTHAESIDLFKQLDVGMTPELKAPSVTMPYEGDYTQEMYAQQMIDEYKDKGVDPARVWAQSFNRDDVLYWIANDPTFGNQAVYLDDRYGSGLNPNDPQTWSPTMEQLVAAGHKIIAPPTWMLVTLDGDGKIVPSAYAMAAKTAGLGIITWTLERSGPLKYITPPGGTTEFYYTGIGSAIKRDGDMMVYLDVLAKDVGILGIFSDWPATVTYYANCMGL